MVGLAEDIYDLYAGLGRTTFKASVFGLVLFPALIIILQRMYIGRNEDTVNTMRWFQVIEKKLMDNGIALEDLDIESDSLLTVCQSVFADPIARGFRELEVYRERM